MKPIVRSILAVLGGMLVAFVLISLVEVLGMRFFPPPGGMDPHDPESMRRAMANMPRAALLCLLVAYAAGSVAGGWVAARFAPSAKLVHAVIVGAILNGASVTTMMTIPHPLWWKVSAVAIYLLGAWSGGRAATPAAGSAA